MDSAKIFLVVSLFIIMLGMGLSLTPADFKRVFSNPKASLVGLLNQIILLPLIGFGVLQIFPAQPEIAVGLMILAACPGGPTSNLITHLAKGDVALSVSLTAISSLITIVTIPFVVNFSLTYFMEQEQMIALNIPETIAQILVITVIPVSAGMFIRAKKSRFADKMENPVKIASAVVLSLVIIGIVLKEKAHFVAYFQEAGIIALVLNISTMIAGMIAARLFSLSRPQAITISIESGIQNGTLAIAIAVGILQNAQMAITPAVYSLIMFGTGALVIGISARKKQEVLS